MEKTIKEVLAGLLEQMGMEYEDLTVELESEGHYRANIESSSDSSLLIGWHGETIAALQYLLKTLVWRKLGKTSTESFYIVLDVDDYRERQIEKIQMIAQKRYEEALEQKRTLLLAPMSPFYRRQIHLHIAEQNNPHISSDSVGEGEARRVRIVYKD